MEKTFSMVTLEKLCAEKGLKLIENRMLSRHLEVVRVFNPAKGEHVVYIYNVEHNAFYEGSYYFDEADAKQRYATKK